MTALREMYVGISFQDNASKFIDQLNKKLDHSGVGFASLGSDVSGVEKELKDFGKTGMAATGKVEDAMTGLRDEFSSANFDINDFGKTGIDSLEKVESSAKDLEDSIEKVGKEAKGTGVAGEKAGADIAEGMDDAEKEIDNVGHAFDDAAQKGSDMASKINKAIAGIALAGLVALSAGITASVHKFVDFDNELRKAGAIAGATADEFILMRDAAIDLGASTSKNATEVAGSMAELASKGFDANQTIAAMPGIIAASEASGESLATAADTVASALNIWGLEAEKSSHVADVLAMAANKSAAGIEDMQYAFKYAGAPAAALGIQLEEVSSAIGIMTNAGLDGSSAGTSLRASLLALNNPAKAQQKIMDKLGFSILDAEGNAKSLSSMVGDLTEATKGMTEADKVATVGKLVGTEAVSGFLALMAAGPAEIDNMTNSLVNSGGAAKETADQMMGGIGGALEELGGTIESLALRIGDKLAPHISDVANYLSEIDIDPIVDGFTEAVDLGVGFATVIIENWDPIVETVMILGGALAALYIQLQLLAFVNTVTGLWKAYQATTFATTWAQHGLNAAMRANPIGIIITAITLLVGIGVALYRNWDTVTAKTKELWAAIGGLEGMMRIIFGPIGILVGAAIDLAKNWDNTKTVWENVWGAIKRSAAESINGVIGLINEMIGVINKIPGVNIPIVAKVDWGQAEGPPSQGINDAKPDGSHASGLASVPFDNYKANLHRDEAVLTARQSNALRSAGILSANSDGTPKLNMSSDTSSAPTNTGTSASPQFIFQISGENAKDIAAEVRREVENIFASLNAVTE